MYRSSLIAFTLVKVYVYIESQIDLCIIGNMINTI